MVLKFSQYMTIEYSDSKRHSPSILCNHKHLVDPFTTPLYSASIDESYMALYFLLDQLIGYFARMNTYHEVDFQSLLSSAQLLSINQLALSHIFLCRKSHESLFPEQSLGSSWLLSNGSHEVDPYISKPH